MRVEYQLSSGDYVQYCVARGPNLIAVAGWMALFFAVVVGVLSMLSPAEAAEPFLPEWAVHLIWIAIIVAFWCLVYLKLKSPRRHPVLDRAVIVAAAASWTAIVVAALARAEFGFSLAMAAVVLLLCVLMPLMFRYSYHSTWKRMERLHHPFVLDTSEQGMTISGGGVTSRFDWDAFGGVDELPEILLIRLGTVEHVIIPKCAFKTADDREQFMSELRSRIALSPTACS